jgi:hypothetical protein
MLPKLLARFEFLKILDNLDFKIVYLDKKAPGQPGLADLPEEQEDWRTYYTGDYWDFNVVINDYIVNNLIDNFNNINYWNDLLKKVEGFNIELNDFITASNSRSECLEILFEINQYLEWLKSSYFRLTIIDSNTMICLSEEIDYSRNINIIPNDEKKFIKEDLFIKHIISKYITDHKIAVEQTARMIKNYESAVERKDFLIVNNADRTQYDLVWNKTDTDLLELITALIETKSISNSKGNLSRKDAIGILTEVFNHNIKDAESKLSRATERKKDISPFLASLKDAFDSYVTKKEEKYK